MLYEGCYAIVTFCIRVVTSVGTILCKQPLICGVETGRV